MAMRDFLPKLIKGLGLTQAFERQDREAAAQLLREGTWEDLCGLANAVRYTSDTPWHWIALLAAEVKKTRQPPPDQIKWKPKKKRKLWKWRLEEWTT